ncbi:uncharacterized protein SPPG_04398 [Spizellomyces punctatus DAOM BR117]|uniref:CASTOR ACT domain-containing protein n=1 Tax=Spizellomyces punctatus (strain DAOM BR117) TaxID=645134 RepID=A0A0L0HGX6_SPIPD|nr:uncharacterized protein SPPG_04398 [Spizellomyces punctatus DAOM BR117]KND00054.1 hypothetical protein SPPG_04398 [Spizellomyces punctatus DAOM BR117]|eukprot:XP_016608093.1 hypothetical protein SPPG_04398 [Spizellomyces punctatus DAOM BR117]
MSAQSLTLVLYPTPLSVHRLPPTGDNIRAVTPFLAPTTLMNSLTITSSELSLIVPSPTILPNLPDLKTEAGWRAFQVAGTLDFALVGILASITAPLKEAGVSVFCISTFDTDWILVKEDTVEEARRVWQNVGFNVLDHFYPQEVSCR